MKNIVSTLMLTVILVGALVLAFHVRPVKAMGTIYIRADGSIDPSTAPIVTFDNVTYTITGNITSNADGIMVERSNIIVDGAGYTLQGSGSGNGFYWSGINNVAIRNTNIEDFECGIFLDYSSFNSIIGNNITANNYDGVRLESSNYNSIAGNNITANSYDGIVLYSSSNYNSISGNNITNSSSGIYLESSSSNSITGNTVTDNWFHGIYLYSSSNTSLSGNIVTDHNEHGANAYGIQFSSSNANSIIDNTIADNDRGIYLESSSSNSITGNTVTANNDFGIELVAASNANSISSNTIADNGEGIGLIQSSNTKLYHNNFIHNTRQVYIDDSTNAWDDSYPSGGNYWSDYADLDVKNGPGQDLSGSDGIGDLPYVIDEGNQDRFPLMLPYRAWTSETIYVRADGSVEPTGSPVHRAGNLYTLTGNVTSSVDGIVVERDNIIVDGAGYTVQGPGSGILSTGISLTGRNNVTIQNTIIRNFNYGIWLNSSSSNSVTGNSISNNCDFGIVLDFSSGNSVSGNDITANTYYGIGLYSSDSNSVSGNNIAANNFAGIWLANSSGTIVSGNNITDSGYGIGLRYSSGNRFYHNNFIDNSQQQVIAVYAGYANVWDDGYPSGGNYWSDYSDVDSFRGSNQDESGSDGVWDHPYVIDADNQDRYPLTKPYGGPGGDVDGDRDVDIFDIVKMAGAYGTYYPDLDYNRLCDMELDGDVDIFDLVKAAGNYGKSW